MKTFTIDIYYESDADRDFASCEAEKLRKHIECLSEIGGKASLSISYEVYKEEHPFKNDQSGGCQPKYNLPKQGFSSVTITNECIGCHGYGGTYWPEALSNCMPQPNTNLISCWPVRLASVSKRVMERKREKSVEVTIHEWLHTIIDEEVNGKKIPLVDKQAGFAYAGKYRNDSEGDNDGWKNWYGALLTGQYE